MTTPCSESNRTWRSLEQRFVELKLSPLHFLVPTLFYAWAFHSSAAPLSQSVMFFGIIVCLVPLYFLYRADFWSLRLSGFDIAVGLGITAALLALHWTGLFLSLGGDELYHAERASTFLTAARGYIDSMPGQGFDKYRSSMFNLFDPRHMAVIDIWRILSFVIVLLVVAWTLVCRKLRASARVPLQLVGVLLLGLLGLAAAPAAENHPPLRLLPLFLGELIFGLNSFAFRVPGVIAVALSSLALYLALDRWAPQQPRWWKLLSAFAPTLIPIVYYVSEAVEPSVYGYAAYIAMLLIILAFQRKADPALVVGAAVVACLGVLFRQSTLALWLVVAVLFLASRERCNPYFACKVFFPFLLNLPYLYTLRSFGHAALRREGSALDQVLSALQDGTALMSTLNTTTLPWVVAGLLSFIVVLAKVPRRNLLAYLLVLPAVFIFFSIGRYLWGLGRYQAEYVAPFLALTFFLQALYATRSMRMLYGCLFPVLFFSTIELNSNLALDINYNEWPRMRVTTSANFPYRDALSMLKRRETHGKFVLLGGQPWYGDMVLWLSGFDFTEVARWREVQAAFNAHLAGNADGAAIVQFFESRKIEFVVVQTGTRRENQHRIPAVARLIEALEQPGSPERRSFYKYASFPSLEGGTLDVYARR